MSCLIIEEVFGRLVKVQNNSIEIFLKKLSTFWLIKKFKKDMGYMYIYLLQAVKLAETWQVPFHFAGGGPSPSSLKLSDSGVIPAPKHHY